MKIVNIFATNKLLLLTLKKTAVKTVDVLTIIGVFPVFPGFLRFPGLSL